MQMESSTSLTFYQILSASAKSRTHYYPDFLAQLLGNFFFSDYFRPFSNTLEADKSSWNCNTHLKLGILAMVEVCKAANGVGDKSVEKKAENASSECIILRE